MSDASEATYVLESLRQLGFRFLTLPRYERQIAAERGGFVVLLEYMPAGQIRQFSAPGYLIDGQVGVLIERGQQQFFVAKQREVAATTELLESYNRFKQDLSTALASFPVS